MMWGVINKAQGQFYLLPLKISFRKKTEEMSSKITCQDSDGNDHLFKYNNPFLSLSFKWSLWKRFHHQNSIFLVFAILVAWLSQYNLNFNELFKLWIPHYMISSSQHLFMPLVHCIFLSALLPDAEIDIQSQIKAPSFAVIYM